MGKTAEEKFGWIKDIDADLTDATQTKTQNIKPGDNKVDTFNEEKSDINSDGKIEGADEIQKLDNVNKEQDEAMKDALKFLAQSVEMATGVSFAKEDVDNKADLFKTVGKFLGKIF